MDGNRNNGTKMTIVLRKFVAQIMIGKNMLDFPKNLTNEAVEDPTHRMLHNIIEVVKGCTGN